MRRSSLGKGLPGENETASMGNLKVRLESDSVSPVRRASSNPNRTPLSQVVQNHQPKHKMRMCDGDYSVSRFYSAPNSQPSTPTTAGRDAQKQVSRGGSRRFSHADMLPRYRAMIPQSFSSDSLGAKQVVTDDAGEVIVGSSRKFSLPSIGRGHNNTNNSGRGGGGGGGGGPSSPGARVGVGVRSSSQSPLRRANSMVPRPGTSPGPSGTGPGTEGLDGFPTVHNSNLSKRSRALSRFALGPRQQQAAAGEVEGVSKWKVLRDALPAADKKFASCSSAGLEEGQLESGGLLDSSGGRPTTVGDSSMSRRGSIQSSSFNSKFKCRETGCIKLERFIMRIPDIFSMKKLFDDIDTNGDGYVTMDEVVVHRNNMRMMYGERLKKQDEPTEALMQMMLSADEQLSFGDMLMKAFPKMTVEDKKVCIEQLPKSIEVKEKKRLSRAFWLEFESADEYWTMFADPEGVLPEDSFNQLIKTMLSEIDSDANCSYRKIANKQSGKIHRKEFTVWWLNVFRDYPVNWEDIAEEVEAFWDIHDRK